MIPAWANWKSESTFDIKQELFLRIEKSYVSYRPISIVSPTLVGNELVDHWEINNFIA